jgi:protocatechuate 3,4-dioxygenase beta subunit
MSWIKQANKIGKYNSTYKGYRIYLKKQGSVTVEENGEYMTTHIVPNTYAAMNKAGTYLEGSGMNGIGEAIDMQSIHDYYNLQDARAAERERRKQAASR